MASPERHLEELQEEIGRDRYLLLESIGSGAMGDVYLGMHIGLRRKVVLKVLRANIPEALHDRFRFEAQILAQLRHENIVDVVDFGSTRERAYLVMEFLEGEPLDRILKMDGPLPIAVACDLTRQVLRGLAWCHGKGVIHRDIKPQNLFVVTRPDGSLRVKLLDFGVARLVERITGGLDLPVARPDNRTRAGQVLGTPRYMAPEQLVGDAVDGRADLYATGAVLYRMLTGRVPFRARTLEELVHAHLTETPSPPSSRRAEISPALDGVVMKALAKLADERFQRAEAFAAALAVLSDDPPGVASTPTVSSVGIDLGPRQPGSAGTREPPAARDREPSAWDHRWFVGAAALAFVAGWLVLVLGMGL